uniref:Chitin-binding type-2 domain-containing protein n=1 Tax=Glossina brevipalpis TaxID=37001 RepID=A0A1A9WP93_9MUSC
MIKFMKFISQLLWIVIISKISYGRYIEERNYHHLSPPQLPYMNAHSATANGYYNYPYGVVEPPYYPHHQANLFSPPGSYFDQRRGAFRPFPGGGAPILIDYHNRCSENYLGLRAHPTQHQYYYLCNPDCIIFGKCQHLQIFNRTSSQCVHSMLNDITNCSSMGIFPVYSDCHLYYKCNQQLQAHIYSCPSQTIFSPYSKQCIAGNSCSPTQISTNSSLFLMENCEKNFPSCAQNGLFRSTSDCSLYYKCEMQNNGIFLQTRFKCPSDMFYDLQRYQCDIKENVACDCLPTVVDLVYPNPNYYQFPVIMKFHQDISGEKMNNCSKAEDKGSGNEKLITGTTTTTESTAFTTSSDLRTLTDLATQSDETLLTTTTTISPNSLLDDFKIIINNNDEETNSKEEFLNFNPNTEVFFKETLFTDTSTIVANTDFTTDLPDEGSTTTTTGNTETNNFSFDSLALKGDLIETTQGPELRTEKHNTDENIDNSTENPIEQPFIEIFTTTNEGITDSVSEESLNEITNIVNSDNKTDFTQHISTTITQTNQLHNKTESISNIKHKPQIILKSTTTSPLSPLTVNPNDFNSIDYDIIGDEKAVLDDELVIEDLSEFIKQSSNRNVISEQEGSGEEEEEDDKLGILNGMQLANENLKGSDVKNQEKTKSSAISLENASIEIADLLPNYGKINDCEKFGDYRKPFKECTTEQFLNEKSTENVENILTSSLKYLPDNEFIEGKVILYDDMIRNTSDILKDEEIEIEFLPVSDKNNAHNNNNVSKANSSQSKNNLKSEIIDFQYDSFTTDYPDIGHTSTQPTSKLTLFQNITKQNNSNEIILNYFLKNNNNNCNIKMYLTYPYKHHSTHLQKKDTEPVIFTNFSITVTEAGNGSKLNATIPRLEIQIEDPLDVHFLINPYGCTHNHHEPRNDILVHGNVMSTESFSISETTSNSHAVFIKWYANSSNKTLALETAN